MYHAAAREHWPRGDIRRLFKIDTDDMLADPLTKKLDEDDKTGRVWSLADGALLRTLNGHRHCVSSVHATADGHVVSGSWDTTVRVWSLADGALLRTLKGHTGYLISVHATAVAFSAVEPSMPRCPQANDSPARLLIRIA